MERCRSSAYMTGCKAAGCAIAQVNAGVPYVLLGGTPFWGSTEVKDVVAYLRLAVNLDDTTGAPPLSGSRRRCLPRLMAGQL